MADNDGINRPKAVAFPPTLIPHVLDYFDRINRPMLPMGLGGFGGGGQGPFALPQSPAVDGSLPQAVISGQAGDTQPGAAIPQDILNQKPLSLVPDATHTCTVDARVVGNHLPTTRPNVIGAYQVPEAAGTGVVDRSQWAPQNLTGDQQNAYIGQFRNQVSAWAPDGKGGFTPIFNGISDNMGGKPGEIPNLEAKNLGRVLIELPGSADRGTINGVQLRNLPGKVPCPAPSRRPPG